MNYSDWVLLYAVVLSVIGLAGIATMFVGHLGVAENRRVHQKFGDRLLLLLFLGLLLMIALGIPVWAGWAS